MTPFRHDLVAIALFFSLTAPCHAQLIDQQDFTLIARGRYLATVGDCTACHTKDGGAFMAGGRALPTPFGRIVSPNITPDRATGIGAMSDETFYNAMHNGMTHERLYPAMPYPYYTKATRADVMAIRAWLTTIPPTVNEVHSNTLPFPFNVRLSMWGWNTLFFTPGEWHDQQSKSADWNRGGYLVEGLGHCGACHTPKNILGADDNGSHLQGYALQGWFAPNITGDKHVGVGAWSAQDIVDYLKTGANQYTAASGPMAEEIRDSTSHWSLDDLQAAATYLLDQSGSNKPAPQPVAANDPAVRAGQAIYVDQCSACHTMDGSGVARLLPTLKNSPFVQQDNPDSLLHVVLNGTRAVSTSAAPTAPAMPNFDWKLSDEQVAAVVTFIRNSWGNAAPAVTAAQAHSMRNEIKASHR